MYADDSAFLVSVLIWAVIWGALGYVVERSKGGGGGLGMFLGVLLGPIGLIIAAVRTPEQVAAPGAPPGAPPQNPRLLVRECPHCKEAMRRDASVCPHCQRDSDPWTFRDGRWWVGDQWFDEKMRVWVRESAAAKGPDA